MSFAIGHKNETSSSVEEAAAARTTICVSVICLLASAPLLVSMALMVFAS